MNHCLFKAKDTKGAVGNTVDYSSLTIEEKKQDILETYTQAGVQLGRQWLDAKN